MQKSQSKTIKYCASGCACVFYLCVSVIYRELNRKIDSVYYPVYFWMQTKRQLRGVAHDTILHL